MLLENILRKVKHFALKLKKSLSHNLAQSVLEIPSRRSPVKSVVNDRERKQVAV
jgi:hypothetical protein